MTDSFAFLVITFAILIAFEALNGWTDAPNAIATVVSTRVMPPMAAVAMANDKRRKRAPEEGSG